MTLQLAYYGDDFTGSTDALEFLTRAGVRTLLFTSPPTLEQLARYPDLAAVGVAGLTRSLAPDAMERELRPALAALRALRPRHVHYKVCSTFDSSPAVGSIGRAIDVGAAVFGGRFVPLVVGAPALGRYCVFGNLFARFGIGSTGAIHRLDRHPAMSKHPITPADEADLRLHLARQTRKRIGLVDVLALAGDVAATRAALDRELADGAEIVLFDALDNRHLANIGALLEPLGTADAPLFSVGSSAIEMALGSQWNCRFVTDTFARPGAAPLLVLSGSCSPVTVGQIRWALCNGFAGVSLDAAVEETDLARSAADAVRSGRSVVVHSNPAGLSATGGVCSPDDASVPDNPRGGGTPPTSTFGASALGAKLGRIARAVIAATGVKRLLVAGGDTSSYAARALGIEAVEMLAPLAPGAPLCRAHAPGSPADGIEVNFKGGQVGAEDYFGAVARGRL